MRYSPEGEEKVIAFVKEVLLLMTFDDLPRMSEAFRLLTDPRKLFY
jgi:hypothetical protein